MVRIDTKTNVPHFDSWEFPIENNGLIKYELWCPAPRLPKLHNNWIVLESSIINKDPRESFLRDIEKGWIQWDTLLVCFSVTGMKHCSKAGDSSSQREVREEI